MPLTAEKRNSFLNWATQKAGCQASQYLQFKDSELGGTGVFFDIGSYEKKHGKMDLNTELDVLKIPHESTFSLDSISKNLLKPQVLQDSQANGDFIQMGQVLSTFLTQFHETFANHIDPLVAGGLNETNILVGEVQILVVLKLIREKLLKLGSISDEYKKFLENSAFATIDPYLDLLYSVEVPSLPLDEYYDEFKDLFKYHLREYRSKIEILKSKAVLKALDSIDVDLGFDPKELANETVLRQIEAAVISRILEIPEDLKQKDPETDQEYQTQGRFDKFNQDPQSTDFRKVLRLKPEEIEAAERDRRRQSQDPQEGIEYEEDKENDENYGYSVSSTLVPVIDFVNHSNDLVNASFDVDRANQQVILVLDNKKFQNVEKDKDGLVELFISYSEVEDVYKFVHSYGFIPKSVGVSLLYEMPIDREYLKDYYVKNDDSTKTNLGLLLKWLNIQPIVQFVFNYDSDGSIHEVSLNLDDNYFPFAFTKNLKYVPERAFKIFKELSEADGDFNVPDDYVNELVKLQESNQNDIIESFGLTPYVASGVDLAESIDIEYLLNSTKDEEVNGLIGEFIDFLVVYGKVRIEELDGFLSSHSNRESVVYKLAESERQLLERFIARTAKFKTPDEKVEHLVLGPDDLHEEWLKNRMRPITLSEEAKIALQDKYVLQRLKDMTLSKAEENDVSYEDEK